jgi:hypothetical protein
MQVTQVKRFESTLLGVFFIVLYCFLLNWVPSANTAPCLVTSVDGVAPTLATWTQDVLLLFFFSDLVVGLISFLGSVLSCVRPLKRLAHTAAMEALMLSLSPQSSSAELLLGSDFAVDRPRLIVSLRLLRSFSLDSFIGEVPVGLIVLVVFSLGGVAAAVLFLGLNFLPPGASIFCTASFSICFSFALQSTFDGMVLLAGPNPLGVGCGWAPDLRYVVSFTGNGIKGAVGEVARTKSVFVFVYPIHN